MFFPANGVIFCSLTNDSWNDLVKRQYRVTKLDLNMSRHWQTIERDKLSGRALWVSLITAYCFRELPVACHQVSVRLFEQLPSEFYEKRADLFDFLYHSRIPMALRVVEVVKFIYTNRNLILPFFEIIEIYSELPLAAPSTSNLATGFRFSLTSMLISGTIYQSVNLSDCRKFALSGQ